VNASLTVSSADVGSRIAVLTVAGELDFSTEHVLRLEAATRQQRGRHLLVLDLTRLTFCDSTGMGLFIDVRRATRERGGWLRLVGVQPRIHEMFRTFALDRLLELYDSTDAALGDVAADVR